MECIFAEGVELCDLSPAHRSIVLRVSPGRNGTATIGRQHQPEFFERLVPKKDRLTAISRAHFEFMWDPVTSSNIMLKKLSLNPLALNKRPIATNEMAPAQHGARIGFSVPIQDGPQGSDQHFLELRVILRSSSDAREGPHPSAASRTPPRQTTPTNRDPRQSTSTQPDIVAVLECISALGTDTFAMPEAERFIELPLDTSIEIGKSKQVGFFDHLLKAEPKWLSFISRTHLRLRLSHNHPSQSPRTATSPRRASLTLSIENLSANVVLVDEHKLPKDRNETIQEGGTIAFVAAPDPPQEKKFLVFALRRKQR